MYCYYCGKEFYNDSLFCPHCGAKARDSKPNDNVNEEYFDNPRTDKYKYSCTPPEYKAKNPLAITGFIFAFIFPLLGLILSAVGLGRRKYYGGTGKELAIAGIVISSLGVLFTAAAVLLFLLGGPVLLILKNYLVQIWPLIRTYLPMLPENLPF